MASLAPSPFGSQYNSQRGLSKDSDLSPRFPCLQRGSVPSHLGSKPTPLFWPPGPTSSGRHGFDLMGARLLRALCPSGTWVFLLTSHLRASAMLLPLLRTLLHSDVSPGPALREAFPDPCLGGLSSSQEYSLHVITYVCGYLYVSHCAMNPKNLYCA